MILQKYFLPILTLCLSAVTADAVQPSKGLPLPAVHAKATDVLASATPFMSDAIANARLNSPFLSAAIEAQKAAADETDALIEDIKSYAAGFLGTRYRLGASGPNRFDCSGFTSYVFRNFGFDLNRDSRSQFKQGESVAKDELRPGDLLFFSSRSSGKGRVGHVAMVVDVNADGSCTFIHASTKHGVTYQKFPDGGYYSRHYIGAKRIVGTGEFAGV